MTAVHRKIVNSVLAKLSGDRAQFFNGLVDRVERDSRIEASPNLVFLVLKETIPYLPTYLPENELADRLFAFVADNQARLNRVIHDRRDGKDPGGLAEVTKEFVLQTLSFTLETPQVNEIQEEKISEEEENTYRFSWPELDTDFPYGDDDDDDED